MLRDEGSAAALRSELGLRRPYVDQVLRHDRRKYADFLTQLADRGLLSFIGALEARGELGVRFVMYQMFVLCFSGCVGPVQPLTLTLLASSTRYI